MVNAAEIKRRREAAGYTLAEFAKLCGFVAPDGEPIRQRVVVIESGSRANVTADTLWAIAKALPRCKMEDLMCEKPPKKPRKSKRSPK